MEVEGTLKDAKIRLLVEVPPVSETSESETPANPKTLSDDRDHRAREPDFVALLAHLMNEGGLATESDGEQ